MATALASSDPVTLLPASDLDRWEAFRVPWTRHASTLAVSRNPRLWIHAGNLESRVLAEILDPITIQKPIYVAGLARSGSTVILETVASYPGVASNRYRDFPFVFTPYWWNRFLDNAPRKSMSPRPRVHADGLSVSPESPEALEEPLWRAFFRAEHERGSSQILDEDIARPDFEAFYLSHLRKLLAIRQGERYACKGNYHVARLEYLLKLFPDARLIIPFRNPRDQVASLMKQHRLFTEGETRHPRALAQMQATGHFEFGLDRRLIQFSKSATGVESVESLWSSGQEARGWARYWSQVYGFLAERLAASDSLRRATLVVGFEELCRRPSDMLHRIEAHCEISVGDELHRSLAKRLHAPTYYRPKFTAAEEAAIDEETSSVVSRFADSSPQRLAA